VYGTLKGINVSLDNFYIEFLEMSATGLLPDPFQTYINMFDDIIDSLNSTSDIVDDYLSGKPRKIRWEV